MRTLLLIAVLLSASPVVAGTRVLASIQPLAMVARQVLGPQAQVETLRRPGQGLHGWRLTPGQVRELLAADLVVWLGARAEPALARLMQRREGADLALLSLDGIVRLYGHEHHHAHGFVFAAGPANATKHDHDHGHDTAAGHHHATGLDPHLWLHPQNIARLAEALAARLGVDDRAFQRQLARTRERIQQWLAPFGQQNYISYHDPWGYFATAFSLQRARMVGASASAGASVRRLVELARLLNQPDLDCVLAEPSARRALLERLCGADCRMVKVDPLGRGLTQIGYTEFLERLGRRFRTCLGGQPAGTADEPPPKPSA